jgi:DNA gyrase subunit B
VAWLTRDGEALHDGVASLSKRVDGIAVDVAMRWCGEGRYSETMLLGYANSIRSADGGTHVDGLRAALTRTVNALGRKYKHLKEGDAALAGEHVREGSPPWWRCASPSPEFEGQTKQRLGNPEVRRAVQAAVARRADGGAGDGARDAGGAVPQGDGGGARPPSAARKARELVRRKGVLNAQQPARQAGGLARSASPPTPRSSWWRATPPAAPPSRGATGARRRCCRCAARF